MGLQEFKKSLQRLQLIMKTPFDDFMFNFSAYCTQTPSLMGTDFSYELSLSHRDLPIYFKTQYYVKEDNSDIFNRSLNNLYKQVYLCSVHGKASIPIVGGLDVIYFGEYDHELEKWFVKNINGEGCYSSIELLNLVKK